MIGSAGRKDPRNLLRGEPVPPMAENLCIRKKKFGNSMQIMQRSCWATPLGDRVQKGGSRSFS